MDPSKRFKDATDSPMRSLSSFKDEIPGGEFPPPKSDGEDANKSFREFLDSIINSAPFHITMLLLMFGHCFLLTAEVLLAVRETTGGSDDSIINALASTCLAFLSFFVLEVTLRVFSTGCRIFKRRLEVFDILVVVTAFILDVVVFAANIKYDWCRALSYLILLRCWRFYGIYYAEVKRIHNDMRTDIEMAKYGRRQAETQADALQSERDAQLKEIFHLREFLHQHSLDPDSKMPDCVQSHSPNRNQPGYSRTVSIDRAETMREETRLYPAYSEESAISSIVDAKQNAMPPHRHLSTDSNPNETFDDRDESYIEENESEIVIQEQKEQSRDNESSEFETQRQQSGDGEGELSEYESAQEDEDESKEERGKPDEENNLEQEDSEILEINKEYDLKDSVLLERETGERTAVGGDPSFSDDEEELGIDNLGFEDDGVFQEKNPATEMKENFQDSPSKQSIISSDGVSRNELVSVTEDVNGIPMTSL